LLVVSSKKEHTKPDLNTSPQEYSSEALENAVAENSDVEELLTSDDDLDSMLNDLLAENDAEIDEQEEPEKPIGAVIAPVDKTKSVVKKSGSEYKTQTKLTFKTQKNVLQKLKSSLGVKKILESENDEVDGWEEEAVKNDKFENEKIPNEEDEQERIRQENIRLEQDKRRS